VPLESAEEAAEEAPELFPASCANADESTDAISSATAVESP
jgi:hypothetical protein